MIKKWTWILVIGLLFWIPYSITQGGGLTISSNELLSLLEEEQVTIIDVREPHEYAAGHIPGAILIPLGQLASSDEIKEYPLDHRIVVVCRSGSRSRQAQLIMEKMSYEQIFNLEGGMLRWHGPVELTSP